MNLLREKLDLHNRETQYTIAGHVGCFLLMRAFATEIQDDTSELIAQDPNMYAREMTKSRTKARRYILEEIRTGSFDRLLRNSKTDIGCYIGSCTNRYDLDGPGFRMAAGWLWKPDGAESAQLRAVNFSRLMPLVNEVVSSKQNEFSTQSSDIPDGLDIAVIQASSYVAYWVGEFANNALQRSHAAS